MLGGGIDTVLIIGTLFFLIPYNLLMYGVNDVFDYESDMHNPRKGGIEGAVEAKQYHSLILRASFLLCLPFVAAFLVMGDMQSNLVLGFVVFMVVAYSLKYLRFKERPVLDSITSSIHFVGPLVYAAALLGFPAVVWPYVTAFFLWGMASHAFGAVQDVIPDRQGNLASIATVFGARWTVRLSVLLYVVSSVILITASPMSLLVAIAGIAYALNCAPYLNVTDENSATANKGWRRFIWLNLVTGSLVTVTLLYVSVLST